MKELLSIEDPIAGLLGAWSAGLNLGSALLRIALIVALAASIGCERSSKRHSAGLRTFGLAAFSATVSMLLDQYVYVLLGCKLPLLSAATLLAVTSVSANSILYSSRGQIKGLTTSAGLVSCCILGFATGAGLAAVAALMYIAQYPKVYTTMGATLGIYAFVAAVRGGIGSLPGAMLGGLLEHDTKLRETFVAEMGRQYPALTCTEPEQDAAAGALMLAKEML